MGKRTQVVLRHISIQTKLIKQAPGHSLHPRCFKVNYPHEVTSYCLDLHGRDIIFHKVQPQKAIVIHRRDITFKILLTFSVSELSQVKIILSTCLLTYSLESSYYLETLKQPLINLGTYLVVYRHLISTQLSIILSSQQAVGVSQNSFEGPSYSNLRPTKSKLWLHLLGITPDAPCTLDMAPFLL